MLMGKPNVIIVAFFALLMSCRSQTVCKDGDNSACRCDLANGNGVIDLSFGSKDPTKPLFPDIPSPSNSDGITFSYNPCYEFSSPDSPSSISGLAVLSTEADTEASTSYYTDIGQQNTGKFISDKNGEVSVVYTSSDGFFVSTVKLICSQSGSNQWAVDNAADPNYAFTLAGPGVCPTRSSSTGGLSGGSIFLILFSVAIVIYVVGGVIYQKKKNNATGADVIPNKDFWVSLPGLIKDGAVFLFYKCQRKSPPGAYESIE